MLTKKHAENLLLKGLLLAFVFIPLIRFCAGLLQIRMPVQYAPIILLAFLYLLLKARGKYFWYVLLNIAILIINLINTEDISSAKMQIAAFTYINSFLSIYLFFKDEKTSFESFIRFYFKPLFYTSLGFMIFCLFCFGINIWKYPFSTSMTEVLNYLTFARGDSPAFRSNILIRFNPLAAIFNIGNIQYIGPQLIISPLIAYIHLLLFPNEIKSRLKRIFFITLLALLILITNSRAMLLTSVLIALTVFSYRLIKDKRLSVLTFAFIPLPFIQYFLSDKFISGRLCQFNFVKSDLSLFGHGIGAGISRLNTLCGEGRELERLQGIQSYCFDNIHLEFLHYFGLFGYSILIISSIYYFFKNQNLYTLILSILVYFFFSLNFNLFEIYFIPLLTLLICLSIKPMSIYANNHP